jgi:hypothetical protein
VAGAAAAAAAVVVGAAAVQLRGPGEGSSPVLASAALEPLAPGESAAGTAEVRSRGVEIVLELELADLPELPPGSFYELWLIDSGVTKLVSLGPLRSDGRYVVPAGVELDAYPVVDVSVEPIDGNTLHSGDSLLRGTFDI